MINVTFDDFATAITAAGYLPQPYSANIFYVKPSTKGTGKVELNVKSGTFIVGSGSKHLEAITAAVNDSYKLVKRAKGWSIFEVPTSTYTDSKEIMQHFVHLINIVEKAVPATTGKPPKGPKAPKDAIEKARDSVNKAIAKVSKPQSAAQIMRAAEIKAKNLATMKAVTAKLNQEAA